MLKTGQESQTPELTGAAPSSNAQSNLEDLKLAREASSDSNAFVRLYHTYFQRVYGYHLLRTNNVDDAQDLTSQTFIAALEGIKHYSGRGSLAAWLMGIAHHKMAQHFRGRRTTVTLEQLEDLPHPALQTEDQADQHRQIAQISQSLTTISPERAEAFILRTFGGLSTAEIALVMKKSEGAVKMLVYRALQDLRNCLNGNFS
jgi:RNA polymerase sigma-70 factor, ECF subfamily